MQKRLPFYVLLICLLPLSTLAQSSLDDINDLLGESDSNITADELLMENDFSDDDSWESDKDANFSVGIDDEQLVLSAEDETTVISVDTQSFDNTVSIVEATQLSGDDNNDYGLICRANDDNEGYYFLITGDGLASIQMLEDDVWSNVVEWDEYDEVNQGEESNELIAVCHDEYLAFYVNGELLIETTDDTFDEGSVGFTTTIYEADEQVEIGFDNLQVYSAVETETSDEEEVDEDNATPTELENHDGDWREAVAELEDLGLIGSGGTLVFNENRAFFDGIGNWFEPLARNASHRDVVMAATLDFTVGNDDEYESCGIMARIPPTPGTVINTYLEVGITNSGFAYWLDLDSDEEIQVDDIDLALDLGDIHHILFIAQADQLTVFLDGELIFDDAEIESRSGSFGITLVGAGAESRCEGTNVWAYTAPAFIEGVCEVYTANTVNQRSGPGTNFDQAGSLSGGSIELVLGQAEGSDGFTWYQLDGEVWVREDIVSLRGDCDDIPVVEE